MFTHSSIADSAMTKRWCWYFAFCLAPGLSGCDNSIYRSYEPEVSPATAVAATQIYFYPNQGQNAEQQDRDRYECYVWAVNQTGFDPSVAQLAPHQQVEVIPESPPDSNTAADVVTGAVVGSVLADRSHREEGAVFGAIAGAILSASADAEREVQAEKISRQINARQYAWIELLARDYRRAMTACLEGRGYVVH